MLIKNAPRRYQQDDEQAVHLLDDGLRRVDRDDLVLLAQLGHDGPRRVAAHRLEVEAAEELCIGRDDTQLLALGLCHDAQGAGELVLDGQAAVEERDHELLGARGEDEAEEDVRRRALAAFEGQHRARRDLVVVLRLGGDRRELLRVVNDYLDRVARYRR